MGMFFRMAALCLICGTVSARGGAGRALSRAESLMEKGKWRSAASKLEKLRTNSKLSSELIGRATVLQAKAYRMLGKPERGYASLKALGFGRPRDYGLELGRCDLALGKWEEAAKTPSRYVRTDGALYYPALWVRCRALYELGEYQKCVDECGELLSGLPKVYKFDENEEFKRIVSDAAELRKKALVKLEIELYGQDYSWYRQGREAEFAGRFREALKFYANPRSGILRDACDCYSANCLWRLGRGKEAVKRHLDLAERKPEGLYTGESLYEAAVLTFLAKRKPGRPLALLERFKSWREKMIMQKGLGKLELPGINDALERDVISKIPKEYLASDDCGNLIRTKRWPGSIDNPLTAPWYLGELAKRVDLTRGFLLAEKGDVAGARKAYEDGCALARESGTLRDDGTLGRLLRGLVNGGCLLPKECFEKLSKRVSGAVRLGYFLLCSEDGDRAGRLFKRILKSKGLKPDDQGAAMVALYILEGPKKAKRGKKGDVLSKVAFNSRYSRLPIGKYALFLRSCRLSGSKRNKEKAYAGFDAAASWKGSSLAPRAALAKALCAANLGDDETAIKACAIVRRHFGGTGFAAAAATLQRWLRRGRRFESGKDAPRGRGRIVRHARTIILPGQTDWRAPLEGLKSADLILYTIRCLPRSDCEVIRSFTVSLTENEPRLPRSKGNVMTFVRAPVMFVPRLEYDFDRALAAKR